MDDTSIESDCLFLKNEMQTITGGFPTILKGRHRH